MADKKISQLTAATTPLAGSEVLPIVQSSTTVKVSVADLTKGRTIQTTGINDNNNNEAITITTTASAVNEFTVANAATGAEPTLSATGSDTNIGINITPKGTGRTTVTQLTTTSPQIITSINDTNGNELVGITATASAVNEITVANAATGANPVISATGTDTNIGITLTPKGTGNLVLTSGNLVVANGNGIDFSATPNTGTSELLDDYEEGTWSPELTSDGGSTAGKTYSQQIGYYVKIGKVVYYTFAVTFSNKGSSNVNEARLSNFPFTFDAAMAGKYTGYIMEWQDVGLNSIWFALRLLGSTTRAYIETITAASTSTGYYMSTSYTDTTSFRGGGFYFVD